MQYRKVEYICSVTNLKNSIVMKQYHFTLKIGNRIVDSFIREYPNMQIATMAAEAFLDPESDTFYDEVIFFNIRGGYLYQTLYRMERWQEASENIVIS